MVSAKLTTATPEAVAALTGPIHGLGDPRPVDPTASTTAALPLPEQPEHFPADAQWDTLRWSEALGLWLVDRTRKAPGRPKATGGVEYALDQVVVREGIHYRLCYQRTG